MEHHYLIKNLNLTYEHYYHHCFLTQRFSYCKWISVTNISCQSTWFLYQPYRPLEWSQWQWLAAVCISISKVCRKQWKHICPHLHEKIPNLTASIVWICYGAYLLVVFVGLSSAVKVFELSFRWHHKKFLVCIACLWGTQHTWVTQRRCVHAPVGAPHAVKQVTSIRLWHILKDKHIWHLYLIGQPHLKASNEDFMRDSKYR